MKKLFIVANWKAHKTKSEALTWLHEFGDMLKSIPLSETTEIVVLPPYTLLSIVSDYIQQHNLPLIVGAQDSSFLGIGSYTGEIPAMLLAEHAKYSLVGHSERRRNFGESDQIIEEKTRLAIASNITPIICVQSKETPVINGVKIVAYEPISAIGTGNPDSPENANSVAGYFKEVHTVTHVLYGGSVKAQNVNSFTTMPFIDGVLVGGGSLDAQEFINIIKNAQ